LPAKSEEKSEREGRINNKFTQPDAKSGKVKENNPAPHSREDPPGEREEGAQVQGGEGGGRTCRGFTGPSCRSPGKSRATEKKNQQEGRGTLQIGGKAFTKESKEEIVRWTGPSNVPKKGSASAVGSQGKHGVRGVFLYTNTRGGTIQRFIHLSAGTSKKGGGAGSKSQSWSHRSLFLHFTPH